jgi:GT2 family glycosyltransferase
MALSRRQRAQVPPCPARGPGWFTVALPPGAAGRWCRVTVTLPSKDPWWAKLIAEDHARGQIVREAFLGPRKGAHKDTRALLLHVPQFADRLLLHLITQARDASATAAPAVTLDILGRAHAAGLLLANGAPKLPACLRGNLAGLAGRIRAELGQAPARAGEPPGYDIWLSLHDHWTDQDRQTLLTALASCPAPAIEILLIGRQAATSTATFAAQWLQPVRISTAQPNWERLPGTWLLILHAHDTLAPHALACFARAIRRDTGARCLYADADIAGATQRHTPVFKPQADPWMIANGLLLSGACVFHPDIQIPHAGIMASDLSQVLAERLAPSSVVHVPFILTHLQHRPHAAPAPRLDMALPDLPSTTIIVPSACRQPHVVRCLTRLLAITEPGDFEILLAVTRIDPTDRRQAAILKQLRALPRLRVLDLDMHVFNYPAVNNAASRHAHGSLLLLLNDDVAPIRPDWLRRMAAFTSLQTSYPADVVGARLLYGNDRIQHAGVIMGLANLCEHAFRLTARDDAGPHGIARMTRQVSAVTAACMLVRRELWEKLGGMDESFAIALNDVDFCLRAGQAGARILFAAGVELHHYESLSLGRHYRGARAGLEAVEVRRLRDSWQSVIAADPFYNLQASIEPGREFQPAFPPRLTPHSWTTGETPAQG